MDVSAVADLSVSMSLSKTQQAAGTMVLQKAMDSAQTEGASLIQCMQDSAVPPSGHVLDVLV